MQPVDTGSFQQRHVQGVLTCATKASLPGKTMRVSSITSGAWYITPLSRTGDYKLRYVEMWVSIDEPKMTVYWSLRIKLSWNREEIIMHSIAEPISTHMEISPHNRLCTYFMAPKKGKLVFRYGQRSAGTDCTCLREWCPGKKRSKQKVDATIPHACMRWDGAKLTFPRTKFIKIGWEWVSVLVNVGIYQCDVMILWNIGATMGSKKHDVAFDEKVIFEHDVKKLTHHTLQWNLPQCEITCRWTKCYPWGIRNIRVNSNILGHPLHMRTYFVLLCLYDAHTKESNPDGANQCTKNMKHLQTWMRKDEVQLRSEAKRHARVWDMPL